MSFTRRQALKLAAAAVPAARSLQAQTPAITSGPFRATRESLKMYRAPDWFRNAKFVRHLGALGTAIRARVR